MSSSFFDWILKIIAEITTDCVELGFALAINTQAHFECYNEEEISDMPKKCTSTSFL